MNAFTDAHVMILAQQLGKGKDPKQLPEEEQLYDLWRKGE
jgi:hypothetical protein